VSLENSVTIAQDAHHRPATWKLREVAEPKSPMMQAALAVLKDSPQEQRAVFHRGGGLKSGDPKHLALVQAGSRRLLESVL
jgi:hypothetical protein